MWGRSGGPAGDAASPTSGKDPNSHMLKPTTVLTCTTNGLSVLSPVTCTSSGQATHLKAPQPKSLRRPNRKKKHGLVMSHLHHKRLERVLSRHLHQLSQALRSQLPQPC